jgi:catechol 2,3-dioxygenase-like lactoylglutathione lyase family enzyme
MSRPRFRFKAVTITCTDLERSRRVYEGVLGAEPVPTDDGIGCPWYRLGGLTVTLVPNATAAGPGVFTEQPMFMLWLEVHDIAAAHARCSKHGVRVVQTPDDGTYMLIADPDGLLIEVWQTEDACQSSGS